MTKVFIEPVGVTIEIAEGDTLLAALHAAGVKIPGDCGGQGICGQCLVRLGAGELSPPTAPELRKLSPLQLDDGWRLACQAKPLSARVSIEVRATGGRRRILTASMLQRGDPRPLVSRTLVHLAPATLQDPRSDCDRLAQALDGAVPTAAVMRTLPRVLRDHSWRALATVSGRRVLDVEPPDAPREAYGVAVDIGTSKIIAYLFELQSGRLLDQEALENPQMRYGEEVVSRISAGMQSGVEELARAAREGIDLALESLYERNAVQSRHVYDMTVVGNTAMHHLALGIAPDGLGSAPFAPAVNVPVDLRAADMGLAMNPEAGVHFPPPIAGFVGSDALAVVTATRLVGRRKPAMAIDIGTNTEIALAVGGRVTVTSCASGPAFEGYQIRHGMKAVDGAIEKVTFAAEGRPSQVITIGGLPPVGICGSGVVDVLAGLVKHGVVDKTGRMQPHSLVRRGHEGLEYVLARGPQDDIVFTQQDVRQLQLAKGAIATGWSMLLRQVGLAPQDLCSVHVAGAFGNYLDLQNSLALGLLPPVAARRVHFVGNAAGVGAQMALIDERARRRMATLRAQIRFLDLATDARFHEEFAARLGFS